MPDPVKAKIGITTNGARRGSSQTSAPRTKPAAEPVPQEIEESDAGIKRRVMPDMVGGRLRAYRQQAGLSLRQFAQELGVSAAFVSQIETGKSQPSVGTLYQICQALSISIDRLFAEVDGGGLDDDAEPGNAGLGPAPQTRSRAAGLRDMSDDLARRPHASGPVVTEQHRRRLVLDSGVVWEQLAAAGEEAVDFMFVRYEVGGSSTLAEQLTRHGGVEYGYVISGRLEIALGFETYKVGPGDAISFDSSIPHRLTNRGSVPVEAIWFVHGRNANHDH